MPALVVILNAAQEQKGKPLDESEVLNIRDKATCMAVRISDAIVMEENRGYPDIVAEDVWHEWQKFSKHNNL